MDIIEGVPLEHRMIDLGDVSLHTVVAGEGPLVILLHGFPEFWYSWRHQIPALVRAGFRVAVPDQRGYNLSSKPKGIASYTPNKLTGDVARLIDRLGEKKAHVIGHDWGANVAWMFAMSYPELLDRVGILNVPHPVTFMKHLYTWKQGAKKSWYVFFFQLPWFPERMMRAGDYRSIRTVLGKDPVRKGTFSPEDIELYVQAMKQPGALTGAINYYRAIFRVPKQQRKELVKPIHAPVLVIWGLQDRYLGPELAEPPSKLVPNARVVRIEESSHWVQCDAWERVNELLIEYLTVSGTQALTREG